MQHNSHEFGRIWLATWSWAVIAFLFLPLAAIVAVSFTANAYISLPTDGVSLRWYRRIADFPEIMDAAWVSIALALKAALTATVVGVLAALAIVRYSFTLRTLVNTLSASPLFIPLIVSGLAILVFFSEHGWSNAEGRLYIGHAAMTVPYVVRTVVASMVAFDINQEHAARNLGAPPLRAFRQVTLPQLGPGIFAGIIFAVIVSFDNVSMSIFLVGPGYTTLPVELMGHVMTDNDPMSAAVASLMILFSFAALLLTERALGIDALMKK